MFIDIYNHRRSVGRHRWDSDLDVYLHADERQYLKKKKRLLEEDAVDCINNPRTKKIKKFNLPEYDRIQLESDPRYKHLLNVKQRSIGDLNTDLIYSCKKRYASVYFEDDDLVECNHLPEASLYAWKGEYSKMYELVELNEYYDNDYFDINKVDKCRRSALHFAASWGDANMIKILLDVPSVDIGLKDNKGRTALRLAVEANSYDSVVELVAGGYYLREVKNIDENDMLESIEYAMKNLGDNALNIISFLHERYVTKFDKNLEMKSLMNLIIAASNGIPVAQCIEELTLKVEGIDVNSADENGKSLLMYASEMNLYEVAKVLIQNNADLFHIDNNGKNAMSYAVPDSDIYYMFEIEFEKIVSAPSFNRYLY